eukprot:4988250-Amphidinium_carterae.1
MKTDAAEQLSKTPPQNLSCLYGGTLGTATRRSVLTARASWAWCTKEAARGCNRVGAFTTTPTST